MDSKRSESLQVMVQKPELLLLDESESGVDLKTIVPEELE